MQQIKIKITNQLTKRTLTLQEAKCYFEKYLEMHKIDAKDIEINLQGTVSFIFKYKTKENGKVCFKISVQDDAEQQIYFLRKLEQNNIRAAKVIDYDITCSKIPWKYYIMTWIDGDDPHNATTDKLREMRTRAYAKALKQIHQISTEGFGDPKDITGRSWTHCSWLEVLQNKINLKTAKKLFTKNEIQYIQKLTMFNPKLVIKQPSLLHGDIPNGVTSVKPKIEFLGFIDPGSPIGGDPMYDLATPYIYNTDGDINHKFTEDLIAGYNNDIPLKPIEKYRLQHLRLFHLFYRTCYFHEKNWQTTKLKQATLQKLNELHTLTSINTR